MRTIILRAPAIWFLVITFIWSWGFWIPLLNTDMSELTSISPTFFVFAMLGGFGPTFTGLFIRSLLPKDERPKLLTKPSFFLYFPAALTVPVVTLASLGINHMLGLPSDPGDIISKLPIGLIWPLFAALGEEFGWR